MTSSIKFSKFNNDYRNKKKNGNKFQIDEENVSFKEVKREKQQKQYRNFDNALRSKDLDKLLSYDDD